MSQILFSYPAVPSNFKNLIVVPDVGFVSTPENPFEYIKGEKYLKASSKRFNLKKPFIIGKHHCDKQKDFIVSGIDEIVEVAPPILSIPTDMLLSRDYPRLTELDRNRCEEIYKEYEKFVNTNRNRLVATVSHSQVEKIFMFSRFVSKFKPRIKLTVQDLELLGVTSTYKKKFSKVIPLTTTKIKSKVEMSKEDFEINFNFPFSSVFWRDDYYLKIYSSGLLELIPVKYNFSLFIKGEYSVLKKQEDDELLAVA